MPKSPDHTSPAQQPTLEMDMRGVALVTFDFDHAGPAGLPFHDIGYMPVNELTIGGNPGVPLPAGLDGKFIRYESYGVQAADGSSIDYSSLHYELVGYKGSATFGHTLDQYRTPTVSGTVNQIVLAKGDLIPGYGPDLARGADGGISGKVQVSVQVGAKTVGTLDISVQHASGDIGSADKGFTLDGGMLHASFKPLSG